jgi:hypothetical protein
VKDGAHRAVGFVEDFKRLIRQRRREVMTDTVLTRPRQRVVTGVQWFSYWQARP